MVSRFLAPPGHLSIEDAALRSGYMSRYLIDLARTGRLQARRVGRKWFIDEQALDAFVINRETRTLGRPRKSMRQWDP
jgi:excisionase family DNA binding protein